MIDDQALLYPMVQHDHEQRGIGLQDVTTLVLTQVQQVEDVVRQEARVLHFELIETLATHLTNHSILHATTIVVVVGR